MYNALKKYCKNSDKVVVYDIPRNDVPFVKAYMEGDRWVNETEKVVIDKYWRRMNKLKDIYTVNKLDIDNVDCNRMKVMRFKKDMFFECMVDGKVYRNKIVV